MGTVKKANRGLTENDFRYYGLLLFWTQNDAPKVFAIMRVDCIVFVLASESATVH